MKKTIIKTILGGILLFQTQGSYAKVPAEMLRVPDMMKKMVEIIDKSSNTDIYDAQGQLCKEGGLIRGRLLTAGLACKAQDPARLAYLMCDDTTDFHGSTCDKNITKALGKTGKERAESAVIASIKEGRSAVYKLVCMGDAQFKRKLPGRLKGLIRYCPQENQPGGYSTDSYSTRSSGSSPTYDSYATPSSPRVSYRPKEQNVRLSSRELGSKRFKKTALYDPDRATMASNGFGDMGRRAGFGGQNEKVLSDDRLGIVVGALKDLEQIETESQRRATLPPSSLMGLSQILDDIDKKTDGDLGNAPLKTRQEVKKLIDLQITKLETTSSKNTLQSPFSNKAPQDLNAGAKAVADALQGLFTLSENIAAD